MPIEKDVAGAFVNSLALCFSSMFYSFLISLVLCYLTILPIFRSFGEFLRKFRFLPSAGFSFLFMKITDNTDQQMLWMMIWGITTWLMYSMIGIALSINDDDISYARSLRLSKWQMIKELLIKGKAVDIFQAFISNFAILRSIEYDPNRSAFIGLIQYENGAFANTIVSSMMKIGEVIGK